MPAINVENNLNLCGCFDGKSWLFFNVFEKKWSSWSTKPIDQWPDDEGYKVMHHVV